MARWTHRPHPLKKAVGRKAYAEGAPGQASHSRFEAFVTREFGGTSCRLNCQRRGVPGLTSMTGKGQRRACVSCPLYERFIPDSGRLCGWARLGHAATVGPMALRPGVVSRPFGTRNTPAHIKLRSGVQRCDKSSKRHGRTPFDVRPKAWLGAPSLCLRHREDGNA